MDRKTLNQKLHDRALQLGACRRIMDKWGMEDNPSLLVERYKNDINFCLQNNFPNNEFIKANFPRALLLENGVYVDEVVSVDGESGVYVFNGRSTGEIRFSGYAVATLYLSRQCRVNVECSGYAKVFINLFDDACLSVSQADEAKVYVYRRGNGSVDSKGEVLMRG